MRTLSIETASEACSVALFEGDRLIAHDHRIFGRGHAEHLVPMIAALPDKGKAQQILVSSGPGSFTGVRIGIATARALGIAWGANVQSYPTLALVAALARQSHPDTRVSVAMRAGHGEIFVQNFDGDGMPEADSASLVPQDAANACEHMIIAGTMAEEIVSLKGAGIALMLHPDARATLEIPEPLLSDQLRPIYGRAPDAKLPAA